MENPTLVLTGGGALTAYQVGALKGLAEIFPTQRIPFRSICGTSAGAVNGVYLAARAEDWRAATGSLVKMWAGLNLNNIYRTSGMSLSAIATAWISRTIFGGRMRDKANFLLDTFPLRELLRREVNFNNIEAHIQAGNLNAVVCSATHYSSGTTVSFFSANSSSHAWARSSRVGTPCRLDVEHVMASTAIPVFFPPIQISNDFYGDGCLRQTTPLSPAIHLGADRILCIGIKHDRKVAEELRALSVPSRVSPSLAEITGELMNSIFLDSLESDVERLRRINEGLSKMAPESRKHLAELREIPVLQLKPSRDLSEILPPLIRHFPIMLRYLLRGLGASGKDGNKLLNYLAFISACTELLIELGFNDTIARKNEIKQFMRPT